MQIRRNMMGHTPNLKEEPGLKSGRDPHLHPKADASESKLGQHHRARDDKLLPGDTKKSDFKITIHVDGKGRVQTDTAASLSDEDRSYILGGLPLRYKKYLQRNGFAATDFSDFQQSSGQDEATEGMGRMSLTIRSANTDQLRCTGLSGHVSNKRPRSGSDDRQNICFYETAIVTQKTPEPIEVLGQHNEVFGIPVHDTGQLREYLFDAFTAFQQINCRTLCKSWIRKIEPKKQANYPYNGNLKVRGRSKSALTEPPAQQECDPEETKPKWWPSKDVCPHREPDHIKKSERLGLLCHILMNAGRLHSSSVDDLRRVTETEKAKIRPTDKWEILTDIWKIGRAVSRFEAGEIDGSSQVYVTSWKEEARTVKSGGRSRKGADPKSEGEAERMHLWSETGAGSKNQAHPKPSPFSAPHQDLGHTPAVSSPPSGIEARFERGLSHRPHPNPARASGDSEMGRVQNCNDMNDQSSGAMSDPPLDPAFPEDVFAGQTYSGMDAIDGEGGFVRAPEPQSYVPGNFPPVSNWAYGHHPNERYANEAFSDLARIGRGSGTTQPTSFPSSHGPEGQYPFGMYRCPLDGQTQPLPIYGSMSDFQGDGLDPLAACSSAGFVTPTRCSCGPAGCHHEIQREK